MTFRCRALVLTVALTAAAQAPAQAPAQDVPPPLTRSAQADWPMIGRVNVIGIGARSMCTGTLVAPTLVLTAAHCLKQPGNAMPPEPGDVTFVAGWRQGEYIAAAQASDLLLHPGLSGRPPQRVGVTNPGFDIALIRLGTPMPEAVPALPMAALPGDPAHHLTVIGYRGDRPHIPTRHDRCRVTALATDIFGTDCPVVPGISGAPVLSRSEAGWAVIGVISASAANGRLRSVAVRTDAWAMALAMALARVPPAGIERGGNKTDLGIE